LSVKKPDGLRAAADRVARGTSIRKAAAEFKTLVAARLRHVAGTKWGTRRYLDMQLFRELVEEINIAS
jgi:hypothetical protein